jgi:hypothetical protein
MALVLGPIAIVLFAIEFAIDTSRGKPLDPADIFWAIVAMAVLAFVLWRS